MAEQQKAISILAADVGSVWTHACLIDCVEGVYRLIARAEEPTWHNAAPDALAGVVNAVRRIERIAQRALLDGTSEPITPEQDGRGVDAFVLCANAAPPLSCALVGLTADLSLPSAAHACAGAMVRVTHTVALGQRRAAEALAALAPLVAAPPEVIILTGGFDNGPTAPQQAAAEMLAAIFQATPVDRRPAVIYAGNQEARRPVAHALGVGWKLAVVDNVRPSEVTESPLELQRELAHVYDERQLANLPGMDVLQRWCAVPPVSTADALGVSLQYLARRNDLAGGVLGLDVGASTVGVFGVSEDSYEATVSADLGTATGLRGLLDRREPWRIAQWLPYAIDDNALTAALANTSLRPEGIPQTLNDLMLVQAAAREALRLAYGRWRDSRSATSGQAGYGLIAARGGSLAHSSQDGLAALVLLDALQPVGLARLVLDWGSLWPQLGALAAINPLAASQVLDRDSVRDLGTALCPAGVLRMGERALRLQLDRPGYGVQTVDVRFGDIIRLPLPADETATLKVWPHPHLDVGLGKPGLPAQARVQGGTLGVVVDVRGRPLQLAIDEDERLGCQQLWIEHLCTP